MAVESECSVAFAHHAHHIHRPHLGGFGRKGIELRNDGLFVRNRHVEAREQGMFAHPVAEVAHFDEVEIVILRVDVFAGELLGEKGGRKTVTEGVSDESVLAHVERVGLFLSSVERGESEGEAAEFHIVESCLLEDTLHHFTLGKGFH